MTCGYESTCKTNRTGRDRLLPLPPAAASFEGLYFPVGARRRQKEEADSFIPGGAHVGRRLPPPPHQARPRGAPAPQAAVASPRLAAAAGSRGAGEGPGDSRPR
jgi:hypothetical protein